MSRPGVGSTSQRTIRRLDLLLPVGFAVLFLYWGNCGGNEDRRVPALTEPAAPSPTEPVAPSKDYLPPVGVGRTEIQDAREVTIPLPGTPEAVTGHRWASTHGIPDRQSAFRGPCTVKILLPEGRNGTLEVVGGLLTQRKESLVSVWLYLTGPPVDLKEGLRLIEAAAARFSVGAQVKDFVAKIRSEAPSPSDFGVSFQKTVALTKDIRVIFTIKGSPDEKGWYVRADFLDYSKY